MMGTVLNGHSSKLKNQLETQLNWGECVLWSNYDFERLSEQIADKTGVSLSVSTLKRVLGKVNYKSEPSLTTLNALAHFLDYTDWRDFVAKNPEHAIVEEPVNEIVEPILVAPTQQKTNRQLLVLVALAVAAVGVFSFFFLLGRPKYNPADFSFSSKTMLTEGLPNSVVFDFDASRARDQDSVFISQSWDVRRKVLVSKDNKHHSAIYYYPGYFRAKLLVGNEIIKEHDIQIKTNGWLGLIEADWGKEPFYFKTADLVKSGTIEISKELLDTYNVRLFHQFAFLIKKTLRAS